ncbi:hypothetical protein A33K_17199 [Burkholderia humptydooensis MSMB43]|uniref:Uncharacterized protein n=1 Tax=Burkholderia humptydooensis MSMB43 TaxID=441157 RepID=A0ABN0G1J0_9BURK|nr:hypothetical protein A33K_17199 [Burkholderia humptydooensis MSMB43]
MHASVSYFFDFPGCSRAFRFLLPRLARRTPSDEACRHTSVSLFGIEASNRLLSHPHDMFVTLNRRRRPSYVVVSASDVTNANDDAPRHVASSMHHRAPARPHLCASHVHATDRFSDVTFYRCICRQKTISESHV